jgi:hypothetical protein
MRAVYYMAGGTARRTASGSAAFKTFKALNRFPSTSLDRRSVQDVPRTVVESSVCPESIEGFKVRNNRRERKVRRDQVALADIEHGTLNLEPPPPPEAARLDVYR